MEHKVKRGDTLSFIAEKYNTTVEKIWNSAGNSKLKQKRDSPDILFSGDVLTIPAIEEKNEDAKLESNNKFYCDVNFGEIIIKFLKYEKPRENLKYAAFFEKSCFSNDDKVDDTGVVAHEVNFEEKMGVINLFPEKDSAYIAEKYTLKIGELDPLDTISGIQARLKNLGYYFENENKFPSIGSEKPYKDEDMDIHTKNALAVFQIENDLEPTGIYDDKTKDKLKVIHGC